MHAPASVAAGVSGKVGSSRTRHGDVAMSTRGVVITGGAGGVGYAYADTLMRMGHWVVICDVKDPEPAVRALREKHPDGIGRVYGTICDVSSSSSVEELGEFAKETLSTGAVEAVVKVNLVGVMLCTKVALEIMQAQK